MPGRRLPSRAGAPTPDADPEHRAGGRRMSFATNGNGHRDGDGHLRPEDYTPIWPMVPGTRKITFTVNGTQVEAEEGQTILQACRVLGIEIPTLCYEPKLAPYGACRICMVEVEGHEETPISCGTQIEEGMVITT